jgi:hypothetical protein
MTKRVRKPVKDDYPRPWQSRPVDRDRWRRHRSRLMAELPPGTRPPEWWIYDQGLEPPKGQTAQMLALWNMDLLEDPERGECIRVWRMYFETIGPRWNTGDGWLTGAAARRAGYEFYDIPPELIAEWSAAQLIDSVITARSKRIS